MIDSHCHLDFKDFSGRLEDIIKNALLAGVHTMVNIGADLRTSINSVKLADEYDCIFATVGVHPHDAKKYNADVEDQLIQLMNNKRVVAVGEIGLDFYRDLSPRDLQKKVFRRQLEIAVDRKLPVVIHSRESFGETVEIVKEYSSRLVGGVFHCFPGTTKDAIEVIDLGLHISVGGVITFPRARMAEVATEVPLDKILLETDSPYLTPEPYRGKTNQPAYVRFVRDKLAQLRGISAKEVEKITDRNCQKMYRLVEVFGD
ncbi:MAG: hydrolase TatD [candidate division Zixibacteria bacterium HGW-Zixibacteria-1]|nr:MAG: hydrolase TatD [candidate division Zixibacteria bacterium HGW-Zixibacteria-1]